MSRSSRKRQDAKASGYRSGFEKEMADVLGVKGITFKYEARTVDYVSPVRGGVCLKCSASSTGKRRKYLADFSIGGIILETKGKLDSPGRTKLIAIKKSNPELDIRLVFQRNNRIRRNSPVHYTDWAKANGFKHCVGTKLPAKWVRDLRLALTIKKGEVP